MHRLQRAVRDLLRLHDQLDVDSARVRSLRVSVDLAQKVEELLRENRRLKQELEAKSAIAARAVASFQQRALLMEITRQQNEDLDRLAAELSRAKKVEEARAREIEAAARLKSEFLANFSHEIRTPLNAITGYCDLLARDEGTRLTPHGRRDLSVIKSNAKTLLALINDILDLSKIEAGRAEVVKELVDLHELADECAASVKELLKGKEVELNVDVRIKHVFTDQLKMRQVLLNLLSNAAKFTDAGEIVLTAEAAGSTLVLGVEDTGAGIPDDQLPFIFDKFRQVDGSARRKVGGTGLGLAIVKEVAQLLGGNVTATSTLGRGSKFTVVLPHAIDAAAVRRELPDVIVPITSGEQFTVLVIDDDPMVQHLLRGHLEHEHFRMLSATDGVEGLTLARESRPRVIILDIHLPRLDGWTVLAELKSDPSLAGIPVIMMSVEEQRARGFSFGACEYLVKPVEPDRLVNVVRRAILPTAGDVLVVDDDEDTREMVSRVLRRAGYTTVEARDGEEALLRARVLAPGLVILDLLMPGVDGFEVLRTLRTEGMTMPVVVLTGKSLIADEERILREGLARVVQKGGTALDNVVREAKQLLLAKRVVESGKLTRILYVEDSPQNRDIVRRYLSNDYEIIEAEDGEQGIDRALRDAPEMILMDLSLPRLDGWEATRRLKANPTTRHIPVIAVTAHASREDQTRATEAGCCDYVTKPIERDVLMSAIKRHLPRAAAKIEK
ncbi:MAG: response regulator [Deltaproteobacteria bacterium]|nr:response regulator [Deltaproteobacteria bacterium]MCW5801420.1 response regulator [Deltaproteobacteria bacterium]